MKKERSDSFSSDEDPENHFTDISGLQKQRATTKELRSVTTTDAKDFNKNGKGSSPTKRKQDKENKILTFVDMSHLNYLSRSVNHESDLL